MQSAQCTSLHKLLPPTFHLHQIHDTIRGQQGSTKFKWSTSIIIYQWLWSVRWMLRTVTFNKLYIYEQWTNVVTWHGTARHVPRSLITCVQRIRLLITTSNTVRNCWQWFFFLILPFRPTFSEFTKQKRKSKNFAFRWVCRSVFIFFLTWVAYFHFWSNERTVFLFFKLYTRAHALIKTQHTTTFF